LTRRPRPPGRRRETAPVREPLQHAAHAGAVYRANPDASEGVPGIQGRERVRQAGPEPTEAHQQASHGHDDPGPQTIHEIPLEGYQPTLGQDEEGEGTWTSDSLTFSPLERGMVNRVQVYCRFALAVMAIMQATSCHQRLVTPGSFGTLLSPVMRTRRSLQGTRYDRPPARRGVGADLAGARPGA